MRVSGASMSGLATGAAGDGHRLNLDEHGEGASLRRAKVARVFQNRAIYSSVIARS